MNYCSKCGVDIGGVGLLCAYCSKQENNEWNEHKPISKTADALRQQTDKLAKAKNEIFNELSTKDATTCGYCCYRHAVLVFGPQRRPICPYCIASREFEKDVKSGE